MNTDTTIENTSHTANQPKAASQITAYVEGSQNVAIGEQITQIIGLSAADVQRILEEYARGQKQRVWDGRRPYVGLEAFTEANAEFFFGREYLVAVLLDSVRSGSFVAVAGPSGSGKSSLVQAGLVHVLRRGGIENSSDWRYAAMTPHGQPIEQLALSMARLAGTPVAAEHIRQNGYSNKTALLEQAETLLGAAPKQRLFLFVDQFEELFTQTRSDSERRAFLDLLTTTATDSESRVRIVVALRSDFLSHAAAYAGLREQINRSFHLVGAMESADLAKAIALPALAVGAEIEPELVAQVIADMRGEPGALPLMQFALQDLFDASARKPGAPITLTHSDYLARGGVFEALERYADTVFATLNKAQQETARRVYGRLIEVGRGTLDTRRTADLREMANDASEAERVEDVVQVLSNARLLTTDAAPDGGARTVTIAHEKLIEAWPWLRQLVSENREAIALQNDIADDARRWNESERDLSYLYIGARLATVAEQMDAGTITLTGLAIDFIAAAAAQGEAQRAAERAAQQREIRQVQALAEEQRLRAETETQAAQRLVRRNRWLMAALASAMGALMLAIFFYVQSQNSATAARQAAVLAQAGELAARSALEAQTGDTTKALLLSAEALSMTLGNGLAEPPLVRNALHTSLQAYRGLAIEGPWPATPTRLAISHDGALVAIGGSDGNVRIGPVVADGLTEFTITVPVAGAVAAMSFSPDDRQIAIASSGGVNIQLVIAATGDGSIAYRDSPLWLRTLRAPYAMEYSPDGRLIAVAGASSIGYLLDTESKRETPLSGHGGQQLYGIAFTSDSHYVATGGEDRTVRLWDATDGSLVQTLDVTSDIADDPWTTGLTFLHEDQWLIASTGSFLNLWQRQVSSDGSMAYAHRWSERGHQDTVRRLAKDLSGNCIVTISFDQGAKVWKPNLSSAGEQWTFPIRNGFDAVFWNAAAGPESQSTCSNRLLTVGQDAILRTWNTGYSREVATITPGHGIIRALRILPRGNTIEMLVGADDGILSLFDLADGALVTATTAHTSAIRSVAVTADGTLFATASADGSAKIWQSAPMAVLCTLPRLHDGAITGAIFDRGGRHLLTVGDDRYVVMSDVANCRKPIWAKRITEPLVGAVFLNNDQQIVVAGKTYLWSMQSDGRDLPGQVKHGHDGAAALVPFSTDRFLTVGSGDQNDERAPHIWHISEAGQIEMLEPVDDVHSNNVYAAVFLPASHQVLSGGRDKVVSLWDAVTLQVADTLAGFQGEVLAADVTADGRYAAISGEEGVVRIYALAAATLLQEAQRRIDATLTHEDCTYYSSSVCNLPSDFITP